MFTERRGEDEARRRKPTREVCSSAPDRTTYGNRCRDLIGQPEWGLEVLISWEPHGRSHARTDSLSTDACVLFCGVRWFSRRFHYQWLMAVAQAPQIHSTLIELEDVPEIIALKLTPEWWRSWSVRSILNATILYLEWIFLLKYKRFDLCNMGS